MGVLSLLTGFLSGSNVIKDIGGVLDDVITTEEEIKGYNVVKTILAMSSKFKNSDLDRVSYKDYKGSFKVLVDKKQTKCICSFILSQNKKVIEIRNESYVIENMSISSLTKYKKEILQSALELID